MELFVNFVSALMATSKKCPSCKTWSETDAQECPNCGKRYDSIDRKFSSAIESAVQRKVEEKEYLNSGNFRSRAAKKTAWFIHLIFGALSAAFVWWIAVFHY